LFYIALIESGFSNSATSNAGAAGPWQFMPATARRFGLRVDNWVDERRDPIKATHAAAQYLQFLYGEFGSWYLAAAGYNAGENKIRKALTIYNVSDFWSISQSDQDYLAEETKQYVPRMIAAAIIAKEPAAYGFTEVQYEEPYAFEEMSIHPATSLAAIAKAADINPALLLDLNPELKRAASPPGAMYNLKIPSGSYAAMTQAYAGLTPQERMVKLPVEATAGSAYKVVSGDTLGAIARRHRCTLAQLLAVNPKLNRGNTLRIGQLINIPGKASPASARNSSPAAGHTATGYTVRSGDTLGGIALSHHCTTAQIYALNPGLSNKPAIRAGQILQLPGGGGQTTVSVKPGKPALTGSNTRTAVHVVQAGETINSLARTYNIAADDLIRQLGRQTLYAGEKLSLQAPVTRVEARLQTGAASRAASQEAVSKYYVVQKGDTLWSVSSRFKVSVSDIKRINNLRNDNLPVGVKLQLR
jgi:membrane-bound lytic murein transglycosylase D